LKQRDTNFALLQHLHNSDTTIFLAFSIYTSTFQQNTTHNTTPAPRQWLSASDLRARTTTTPTTTNSRTSRSLAAQLHHHQAADCLVAAATHRPHQAAGSLGTRQLVEASRTAHSEAVAAPQHPNPRAEDFSAAQSLLLQLVNSQRACLEVLVQPHNPRVEVSSVVERLQRTEEHRRAEAASLETPHLHRAVLPLPSVVVSVSARRRTSLKRLLHQVHLDRHFSALLLQAPHRKQQHQPAQPQLLAECLATNQQRPVAAVFSDRPSRKPRLLLVEAVCLVELKPQLAVQPASRVSHPQAISSVEATTVHQLPALLQVAASSKAWVPKTRVAPHHRPTRLRLHQA
jgi:hypothetical protein